MNKSYSNKNFGNYRHKLPSRARTAPFQSKNVKIESRAWDYDESGIGRVNVSVKMSTIDVEHIPSKKRVRDPYASLTKYGVCENPMKRELSLQTLLSPKRKCSSYWKYIDKLRKFSAFFVCVINL